MRKRKNEQGFTLVEVIVVAVIVAVLAAVAIPLYNGYIRDSRTNVCQNTASSVASALSAAVAKNMAPAAGWVVGQVVTIPPDPTVPGSIANTIEVPVNYTINGVGTGSVTVVHTSGATSTAVPYQTAVAGP